MDQNGVTHACERVIASGGAKETLMDLLEPGVLPAEFTEKVKEIPLMDSVFMLHLGVDTAWPEVLRTSSTYFYGSYDIEGQVKLAREGVYHEGAAGFVVHLPSLRSAGMAPKGKNAMTIYTICPERLNGGGWEQEKEKYADKLLEHAEKRLPGLRKHIVSAVVVTPDELQADDASGASRLWRYCADTECVEGAAPDAGGGVVVHRCAERERRRE